MKAAAAMITAVRAIAVPIIHIRNCRNLLFQRQFRVANVCLQTGLRVSNSSFQARNVTFCSHVRLFRFTSAFNPRNTLFNLSDALHDAGIGNLL